jgi:tRNA nucleotidyltransferase/poly(A) polymerase
VRIHGGFAADTRQLLRGALAENVFASISRQRIWNEVTKIFQEELASEAFERMEGDGVVAMLDLFRGVDISRLKAGLHQMSSEAATVTAPERERAAKYLLASLLPREKAENALVAHGLSRKQSRSLLRVAADWQQTLEAEGSGPPEVLFCLALADSSEEIDRARERLKGFMERCRD